MRKSEALRQVEVEITRTEAKLARLQERKRRLRRELATTRKPANK